MKKIDFITLILSVFGILVFGVGMCMGLIPEWNMMKQGIVVGIIGLIILLIMVIVRRKMSGKGMFKMNAKVIGLTIYTLLAVIIFGSGLTMVTMFQKYMIQGIFMGIIGIALLIYLIPMVTGFKD